MANAEEGVAIVGSCNVDLFYYVDSFPKSGETMFAKTYEEHFGGKGANQALQTIKLSSSPEKVIFVGCVGDDKNGRSIINNFKEQGVNNPEKHIHVVDATSGIASITVDSQGCNQIILVPGANFKVLPEHVDASFEDIKKCKVLVCQNEIPFATTQHALKRAHESGLITIYNPAPFVKVENLSEVLKYVSVFVPNEVEAAELVNKDEIKNTEDAKQIAQELHSLGAKTVIITLGGNGVMALHNEEIVHVPVEKVEKVVDTTGAGDSFVGSLSYFLSCGFEMIQAIKLSNFSASVSVQGEGTHRSYPDRACLEKHKKL
ncbi:ribokinase [Acrasis kona]|uniref:Ribokinase n=1 Tax=Acrasis kona TaxID=1008807 RepID=A0AAW2ZLK1_9EUKA